MTEHDIVVHNFPACMVGFSIAWGCGKVVFETVYFGICIAGWWVANTFLMKGKDQKPDVRLTVSTEKPNKGGNDPDPKDPKKPSRFVPAPYHTNKKTGQKSPGPNQQEGQEYLDRSYLVVEKGNTQYQRRVGLAKENYIVFDETSKGEFHGHFRSWEKPTSSLEPLSQKMRNVLIRNKVVNSKGKIL